MRHVLPLFDLAENLYVCSVKIKLGHSANLECALATFGSDTKHAVADMTIVDRIPYLLITCNLASLIVLKSCGAFLSLLLVLEMKLSSHYLHGHLHGLD